MSIAAKVAQRWVKARGIPSGAPKQVKQVAEVWVENAMRAAEMQIRDYGEEGSEAESTRKFWKERIWIDHQKDRPAPRLRGGEWPTDRTEAWIIGDNYDKGPSICFYPYPDDDTPPWAKPGDGVWTYMPPYGSEKVMKGGLREALATAQIMWTG
jgi:hypothetical protein